MVRHRDELLRTAERLEAEVRELRGEIKRHNTEAVLVWGRFVVDEMDRDTEFAEQMLARIGEWSRLTDWDRKVVGLPVEEVGIFETGFGYNVGFGEEKQD